jgi:ketosteroid isomerase-like protein
MESIPINGNGSYPEGTPLSALNEFYAAFNHRDLQRMSGVWLQTNEASMDNPLGGIARSWNEIGALYAKLFHSDARIHVEFFDYTLHEHGDIFLAVGRERGEFARHGIAFPLAIRTSRIFARVNGRWQQLHHHGSFDDPKALARYQEAVTGKAA